MWYELAMSRERELRALARTIEHRKTWYDLQALERAQRAFERAQSKLVSLAPRFAGVR